MCFCRSEGSLLPLLTPSPRPLPLVSSRFRSILHLPSLYVRRAAQLINATADKGDGANPLFLYVAFAHTHTPLAYDVRWSNPTRPGWYKVWRGDCGARQVCTRPRLLDSSPPFSNFQVFGNTLAEVDNAVGEIYATLEVRGLADNTLFLLSSDNG